MYGSRLARRRREIEDLSVPQFGTTAFYAISGGMCTLDCHFIRIYLQRGMLHMKDDNRVIVVSPPTLQSICCSGVLNLHLQKKCLLNDETRSFLRRMLWNVDLEAVGSDLFAAYQNKYFVYDDKLKEPSEECTDLAFEIVLSMNPLELDNYVSFLTKVYRVVNPFLFKFVECVYPAYQIDRIAYRDADPYLSRSMSKDQIATMYGYPHCYRSCDVNPLCLDMRRIKCLIYDDICKMCRLFRYKCRCLGSSEGEESED